jgi:hypothetical protein
MWPALATRCRRALPGRLAWAAALLDPERPLPVICNEPQVRELFHWLQGLLNTERVSIVPIRARPAIRSGHTGGGAEFARSRAALPTIGG